MIELVLNKIKVDETRQEQVIVFRERTGGRYLPVVIGLPEVNAIKLKLSGITPPRPLTHDLYVQTLRQLGARIERVIIDRLEEHTFYAKIILKNGKGEVLVDARPSDSVAIALRAGAPVFAAEEVLAQAGVTEV